MSRAYDEQMEKETSKKRAMMAKGYIQCERCQVMFRPDPAGEFICKGCWEDINEKE